MPSVTEEEKREVLSFEARRVRPVEVKDAVEVKGAVGGGGQAVLEVKETLFQKNGWSEVDLVDLVTCRVKPFSIQQWWFGMTRLFKQWWATTSGSVEGGGQRGFGRLGEARACWCARTVYIPEPIVRRTKDCRHRAAVGGTRTKHQSSKILKAFLCCGYIEWTFFREIKQGVASQAYPDAGNAY